VEIFSEVLYMVGGRLSTNVIFTKK